MESAPVTGVQHQGGRRNEIRDDATTDGTRAPSDRTLEEGCPRHWRRADAPYHAGGLLGCCASGGARLPNASRSVASHATDGEQLDTLPRGRRHTRTSTPAVLAQRCTLTRPGSCHARALGGGTPCYLNENRRQCISLLPSRRLDWGHPRRAWILNGPICNPRHHGYQPSHYCSMLRHSSESRNPVLLDAGSSPA
jgi:hypothetical protein